MHDSLCDQGLSRRLACCKTCDLQLFLDRNKKLKIFLDLRLPSAGLEVEESQMRSSRLFSFLLFSAVFWGVSLSQSADAADLNLFKRYYGTMDFVVKGTGGIRSTGKLDPRTGQVRTEALIDLSDLPPSVDIVAAFLYWQALEKAAKPSLSHGREIERARVGTDYATIFSRSNSHEAYCYAGNACSGGIKNVATNRPLKSLAP